MRSNAPRGIGCLCRRIRCLIVVCSVVASVRATGAQSPPHALTTLPPGDAAYAQLAALDRVGCRPARISPHRPFYVRDVQRAIARFPGSPACAGPVAAALAARFTRRPAADLPHDVATDLAAAVRESAKDTLETFRVGGQATLRGTALGRGEFEPLWAGVRPKDEGTPPLVLDARVRADYACSDAGGSGLDSCTGDVADGGRLAAGLGAHSLTVTARDGDGNQTVVTRHYKVVFGFSGLRVDGVPAAGERAGRRVRVSFALDGLHGLHVLDVLADGSPSSTQVDCDSGAPVADAAATATAGPLRFRHGRYRYSWHTARAWSGTCRALALTLADGSEHDVVVRFRPSSDSR